MSAAGRTLLSYKLQLTLQAPWLVQGSEPGLLGMDAVQLRGPDGNRVLPGSLIQGRLREAWHALRRLGLSAPDPSEWLGPEVDLEANVNGKQDRNPSRRAQRARLWIEDLTEDQPRTASGQFIARVKIDSAAKAADDGALQFIEQAEAAGSSICLSGLCRLWANAEEAKDIAAHLAKGLRWHSQLGALRNIGFGELKEVLVRPEPEPLPAVLDAQVVGRCGLVIRCNQPLAVGNQRVNGNVFRSSDVITGATIKGVLATQLINAGKVIPSWFNRLRVSHALPSATQRRASHMPHHVINKGQAFFALAANELAFQGADALPYATDWKPATFNEAAKLQGWGATRHHLRVRTAIERGRAKDNHLFVYECCVAEADTAWRAELVLPGATHAEWAELITCFNSGLLGPLGKTDAFVSTQLIAQSTQVWPDGPVLEPRLKLMLRSDALLFTAEQAAAAQTPEALKHLYQSQWQSLVDARLGQTAKVTVCSLHARQRLAGGDYLHRRFGQATKPYAPFVLTEAGSYFVLEFATLKQAQDMAQHWQQHGLALPSSVVARHGEDWQSNPYQPQNGWGELAINPELPFDTWPQASKPVAVESEVN
ncbi:MAG: hypothetical protein C4K60_02515 [Ideonella sp. MAG2]|nr:MAG: hypothetical protein C4K60_02515 [Ideonella sp. MAG2]